MQAMGSRRVTRSSRLAWDGLIELYGDEDQVRKLVAELRKAPPTGSDELVALVDKYLSGWRPPDIGE
jgi:hypothetical protein